MITSGIYRTIEPYISNEEHGGGKIRHENYSFLCFYDQESFVGLYLAGKDFFQPYQQKFFDYRGTFSIVNDMLQIEIQDPFLNDTIYFKGEIEENHLILERYRASDEENKIKEVYEYINTVSDSNEEEKGSNNIKNI